MSSIGIWRSLPLYMLVYEELRRLAPNPGDHVTDVRLFEAVRRRAKQMGFEVSFSDFLKALMILEVHGYVNVRSTSEKADTGRVIELVKR